MRKILLLLLITSFSFGQDINPNFVEGTIMFKLKNFVEAKDTSNKILDGIGIKENIEDYAILSDIFRDNSVISFERPSYFLVIFQVHCGPSEDGRPFSQG